MDKILLIDGMNSIHRANIGFGKSYPKQPSNDDGWEMRGESTPEETSEEKAAKEEAEKYVVHFNFFRNLRPMIEMFSPDKCFFVLEGHPQFRYNLFADYKADRIIKRAAKKEDYERLLACSNDIIKTMQHLPITTARAASYECDDVINTLCQNLKDENITILSSDSDFIQILQKGYSNCKIYNPIRKEFMVAPTYPYVAWKCLVGDTADSIPGFAGIGPKKAEGLLADPAKFQKFMSVEENRANFSVYRQLIEFRSVPEEDIELREGIRNFPKLKEEFSAMKFESIVNEKSWEKYTKTFNCLKY